MKKASLNSFGKALIMILLVMGVVGIGLMSGGNQLSKSGKATNIYSDKIVHNDITWRNVNGEWVGMDQLNRKQSADSRMTNFLNEMEKSQKQLLILPSPHESNEPVQSQPQVSAESTQTNPADASQAYYKLDDWDINDDYKWYHIPTGDLATSEESAILDEIWFYDEKNEELIGSVEELKKNTQKEQVTAPGQDSVNIDYITQLNQQLTAAEQSAAKSNEALANTRIGTFTGSTSGVTHDYEFTDMSVDGNRVIAFNTDKDLLKGGIVGLSDTNYYVIQNGKAVSVKVVDGIATVDTNGPKLTQEATNKLITASKEYNKALAEKTKSNDNYDKIKAEFDKQQTKVAAAIIDKELEITTLKGQIKDIAGDSLRFTSDTSVDVVEYNGVKYTYNAKTDEWENNKEQLLPDGVSEKLKTIKQLQQDINNAQGKAKELKNVKAEKVLSSAQSQKLAYELTWKMTNFVLEEFAYPYIDDLCKKDWDASESPSPPIDTNNGGNGDTGAKVSNNTNTNSGTSTISVCPANSFHGEISSVGIEHTISYSLRSCTGVLGYKVYLRGEGNPDYTLDEGVIAPGPEVRERLVRNFITPFTRVCVELGSSERCFP